MSGGGGDMGDPHEDERLSDYHTQEQEYWEEQYRKQEDSQAQESSSAEDDDSDSEGLPDRRADNSGPGIKRQWYHNVDISKFSAGGPGQDTMRRQTQQQR
ncbi:MAG: hypothetical protein ACRDTA_17095 [Pseudonocardiaceae bacterium]